MMEEDKFREYYFKLQRRIRRVEKGKQIDMTKDEKNEEKSCKRKKYQGGMRLVL